MTKRKTSMIGHDPLAWIDPDSDPDEVVESEENAEKINKVETPHPLGIELYDFMQGFELVKDKLSDVVADFYQNLFENYPDVKPLFAATDPSGQEKKLMAALGLLVNNINDVEQLTNILTQLGKRHQGYGATQEHYEAVSKTLLTSLKKYAGRKWTKRISNNWEAVLSTVSDVMLSSYADEIDDEHTEEMLDHNGADDVDTGVGISKKIEKEGVLYLSEVQDISVVAELYESIKSKFDEPEVIINISSVTRIDASSLQVLYSFMSHRVLSKQKTSITGTSEAYDYAIKILGMTDTLKSVA